MKRYKRYINYKQLVYDSFSHDYNVICDYCNNLEQKNDLLFKICKHYEYIMASQSCEFISLVDPTLHFSNIKRDK